MGGYSRRMGNVEQDFGNAAPSTTLLHQLRNVWRSPRGTVLRIEALALVAIALSFLLAAFGSCRRWSNRWVIQKGFLAAQVVSLSLGTYSIGLMQSSPVKSEMYPIWAVSLLTLFGCVDQVTTYIGLDFKGLFLKMIFQLCLYCGYVLVMSASSVSGVVGNSAISMLSAITFIKGFHRSLALVLPSRIRNKLEYLVSIETGALAGGGKKLQVHLPFHRAKVSFPKPQIKDFATSMADVRSSLNNMRDELGLPSVTASDIITSIEDVCLGYSLSHLLQRCFLGLDNAEEMERKREEFESLVSSGQAIDYKRTLKVIEVELAFVYDVFFTSNEFLHYYEAKNSSLWQLASFVGVCFVVVVVSIPGTMGSHHSVNSSGAGVRTVVVETTRADLVITLVILVSLAVLQLVQLMQCWTSNRARVTFACDYVRNRSNKRISNPNCMRWWTRLKVFQFTWMNWFDRWLWQDKLGQHSLVSDAGSGREEEEENPRWRGCLRGPLPLLTIGSSVLQMWLSRQRICRLCHALCIQFYRPMCTRLYGMLALGYIRFVLRELWFSDTKTGSAVRLHCDVKASIADFLGQIKSKRISKDWSSLFVQHGLDASDLPYCNAPLRLRGSNTISSDAKAFTLRVIGWHIATCHCELEEQKAASAGSGACGDSSHSNSSEKNRRVAIALSKYYAYLAVSAPELLPGPSEETKSMARDAQRSLHSNSHDMGVRLAQTLRDKLGCSDRWELLALLWVQVLLYAAPYGDAQRHLQHLSQGGEFITHLWALLYHIGIDKWEREEEAAAAETSEVAKGEASEAANRGNTGDEVAAAETGEVEIEEIIVKSCG